MRTIPNINMSPEPVNFPIAKIDPFGAASKRAKLDSLRAEARLNNTKALKAEEEMQIDQTIQEAFATIQDPKKVQEFLDQSSPKAGIKFRKMVSSITKSQQEARSAELDSIKKIEDGERTIINDLAHNLTPGGFDIASSKMDRLGSKEGKQAVELYKEMLDDGEKPEEIKRSMLAISGNKEGVKHKNALELEQKKHENRLEIERKKKERQTSGGGERKSRYPTFKVVRTSKGLMKFDRFKGTYEPLSKDGEILTSAIDDPEIRGEVKGAQSEAKEFGEGTGKARFNLSAVNRSADYMLTLIDKAVGSKDNYVDGKYVGKGKIPRHSGFESYVGATYLPGLRHLEGTDTASYEQLHLQIRGGAFKEAFESLKGGGQISNVEGEAATQALTRMDKAQEERDYIEAAREFQAEIKKLVKIAHERAAGGAKKRRPRKLSPTQRDRDVREEMRKRGL